MSSDRIYMNRALQLARKGLYTTEPNPRVGCVIVKDERIVGEAWHHQAGQGHAEVLALAQAGEQAQEATAYVTLEPCSHYGRTPPCALALVKAGVKRVVAAMQDPNPLVAGRGLAILQEAGITTEAGLLEEQAKALNPGFISRMQRGRPWVRVKLAMSLDGRTAMASGESVWISGEAARRDVQFLRARAGAVLSTSATVLADDPSLNLRLSAQDLGIAESEWRQPIRVILDQHLKVQPAAKLFSLPGKTVLYHAAAQTPSEELAAVSEPRGIAGSDAGLDLSAMLASLAKQDQVNEVHVEAGPRLAGALLQAGLADELVIYVAAHFMGHEARPLLSLPGLETMAQRQPLKIVDVKAVGEDWRFTVLPIDQKSSQPVYDKK